MGQKPKNKFPDVEVIEVKGKKAKSKKNGKKKKKRKGKWRAYRLLFYFFIFSLLFLWLSHSGDEKAAGIRLECSGKNETRICALWQSDMTDFRCHVSSVCPQKRKRNGKHYENCIAQLVCRK